jgi:hypothetical protein
MTTASIFERTYGLIAASAMDGQYDEHLRLKSHDRFIGSALLTLILADEGGRTRKVVDHEGNEHQLTYIARVDVHKDSGTQEYWLLDNGSVWYWNDAICTYADADILSPLVDQLTP